MCWSKRNRSSREAGGGFPVVTLVAAAAACMWLACCSSGLGQPPQDDGLQAALAVQKAVVKAIARAERSVVAIARVRRGSDLAQPGPKPTDPAFVPSEYGTGVVVSREGLIVTNYHVIGDPTDYAYYIWAQRRPYEAVVQAADPWTDLAVLKVSAQDLQPIMLGDARDLQKGQIVIALGNPYAIARDGEASASWGIISNLSRKATNNPSELDPFPRGQTLHHHGTLIQTDAKLNLGTSGGALINLRGEMIGLTTALAAMDRYEQSAGFAIPVDDTFRYVLEKLKRGEKPAFGFLGVSPSELSPEQKRQGLPGVRIEHVVHGTPAALAGLRPGDVITHVDDQPIYDRDQLMRQLGASPAGANVRLTIQRQRRTLQMTARLSKKYVEAVRAAYSRVADRSWRGLRVDYATAIPQFPENSRNIDPEGCVAIVDVQPDSPAWKAGLRPNTFINFVDGRRVATPDQFYAAVAGKEGPVRVQLTVAQGAVGPVRTVLP